MNYINRVRSNSETSVLSFHLAHNLWIEGDHDFVDIGDDFSVHIDSAMLVRRENLPGERTPTGILTKLNGTFFEFLITEIGACEGDRILELGYHLLQMSEDGAKELSDACVHLLEQTRNDGLLHDATLLFGNEGLTIHSTNAPDEDTYARLYTHCELKKYQCKASRWFGVALSPIRGPLFRLALGLDFDWEYSDQHENALAQMPSASGYKHLREAISADKKKKRKIGRNELCPCGSQKKYKHCCLQ